MSTQRHESSQVNQPEDSAVTDNAVEAQAAANMRTSHRQNSRLRAPGLVLLAGLVVAALAFCTTLFPWVHAHVNGVLGEQSLEITGSQAAPAVSALAMVALAAPLAARIAPQLLRYVIALISLAAGAGIVLSSLAVVFNPATAVVTETSRVTGTVASAGTYTVTFGPWLSCVSGVLIIGVGLWTLAVARYWKSGRKYERPESTFRHVSGEVDNMDAWDLLSRGEDPTAER